MSQLKVIKNKGSKGNGKEDCFGNVVESDIHSPNIMLLSKPGDDVKLIVWSETLYAGFKPDGVYRYKNATLVLTTEGRGKDKYQNLQVAGPTLRNIKKLYEGVRNGQIIPAGDWSQDCIIVPTKLVIIEI